MLGIAIAAVSYSQFDATSGRTPDWVFETPRPFFAGWSDVAPPIIKDNRIYFCAGYGWNREASLNAVSPDGKLLWKVRIGHDCGQIGFANGKIYAVQEKDEPARLEEGSRIKKRPSQTVVIDMTDGKILDTFPFTYQILIHEKLYSLRKDGMTVYNMAGQKMKDIAIENPSLTPIPGLLRTDDGFVKIKPENDGIESVSDKGRRIFHMKKSDDYFCYSSYDAKYDIRKQNKNIGERLTCRQQDTWKIAYDEKYTALDCSTFYMSKNLLFTQQTPCRDKDGYLAINLKDPDQKTIPTASKDTPRLALLFSKTDNVVGELTDPKHIIVKNKTTGERLWDFKATGWLHGIVETKEVIYLYDDDGKLYMFSQ